MQFDMSAPKIFPTCFHQDAKGNHKSLRNWIIGSTDDGTAPHLCIFPVARWWDRAALCCCPWVMGAPLLCNCTLRNHHPHWSWSTGTLQGNSAAELWGQAQPLLISSLLLQEHLHWTEPPSRVDLNPESWLNPRTAECPHPTRSQRQDCCPAPSYSPPHSVCLFTRAAFLNMPTVKTCIRGVSGVCDISMTKLMSNAIIYETKMHPQKQLLWREWEI